MAATALRAKPLDSAIFRALGSGSGGDHDGLNECFARFCKLLGRTLSGLCTMPPNFTVERIESAGAAEPAPGEADGVEALLQQEAEVLARVMLDKQLVFSLCDLLLGGVGNEPPYNEQRPLSHIERELGRHLIAIVAEVLPQAFDSEQLRSLKLWKPVEDEGEEPPQFKPSVRLTILATIMSYSGEVRIELSSEIAALAKATEPATASTAPSGRASGGWGEQIASRLQPSELDVTAVLTSFPMTLEDIGKLHPGQTMRLPTSFAKPVTLETDGVVLHQARLGQQARHFCLSVLQPQERKE